MRAVVVGSGMGGATCARELVRGGFEVTVLEAGERFTPLSRRITWAEPLRRVGLLGGEGTVQRLFPHLRITRAGELLLVRGNTTGGSTVLTCGNMVRATRGLEEIGLDLEQEYGRLEREIGITTTPRVRWRPLTSRMFDVANGLGISPMPTPKAVDWERCAYCGLCELGCVTGARWDSRRFLEEAITEGATLLTDAFVERISTNGSNVSVSITRGGRVERLESDLAVLAAGGMGTPSILKRSGLVTSDSLWADVVVTLGGRSSKARQLEEPPMAWYAEREGYIISPYLDILSHYLHPPWRGVSLADRVGFMVKIADTPNGSVSGQLEVKKEITPEDREKMDEGLGIVERIMRGAGIRGPFVRGVLNGGHLGGTVPLSREDAPGMHPSHLPQNIWVSDLSLLPKSQGMPTMLTTAALALRVSRRIRETA